MSDVAVEGHFVVRLDTGLGVGLRPWRLMIAAVVALVAGLAVPLSTSGPSRAASCPPAGGDQRPFTPDEGFEAEGDDVVLTGGGWGHGVGMSQYGAKGAALLGCDHRDIVTTYYSGATVDTRPMPGTVRLGLTSLGAQSSGGVVAMVTAEGDPVDWRIEDCGDDTAAACDVQPPTQPTGETWRIRAIRQDDAPASGDDSGDASPSPSPSASTSPEGSPSPSSSVDGPDGNQPADGAYVITDASSGDEVWRGGDRFALLTESHGKAIQVNVAGLERRLRWGYLELDSYATGDGKLFVVHNVTSGDGASGMQRYLWGLAEVPASWPAASLRAQALAARSYAIKRVGLAGRQEDCRCDLYATVRDQHYQGWDYEESDRTNGGRWKAAVDATAGQVIVHDDRVVDAFYSSSHGGSSESSKHVWGGDIPYLRAVDTSRWENAEGVDNRRQRWDVGFTRDELADEFGLAEVTSFEIVERGPGGRPTRADVNGDGEPDGVKVVGRGADGRQVTRWLSGEQLRWELDLYSSLVHVKVLDEEQRHARPSPGPSASASPSASPTPGPSPAPEREPDTTRACPPGEVPEDGFDDVPEASVHEPAIDCMVWWEVARGVDDDTYDPLGDVAREQMASFIARALTEAGYELTGEPDDHFADDGHSAHEHAINQLAEVGLVSGTGTDEDGAADYSPTMPVTRDQMASFLVRAYETAADRELDTGGDAFSDDDGNTHETAIDKAHEALIASGTGDGEYDPTLTVSRAQMASFLARTLNGLVEEGHTDPPASDG